MQSLPSTIEVSNTGQPASMVYLLQRLSTMEGQMKHFEATQKLQDELFRLKREESENAAKLERNMLEGWEGK